MAFAGRGKKTCEKYEATCQKMAKGFCLKCGLPHAIDVPYPVASLSRPVPYPLTGRERLCQRGRSPESGTRPRCVECIAL